MCVVEEDVSLGGNHFLPKIVEQEQHIALLRVHTDDRGFHDDRKIQKYHEPLWRRVASETIGRETETALTNTISLSTSITIPPSADDSIRIDLQFGFHSLKLLLARFKSTDRGTKRERD